MNKVKTNRLLCAVILLLCLVATVALAACGPNGNGSNGTNANLYKKYEDSIQQEMKGCFDFFWEMAQTENDNTYGLIVDRYTQKGYASIASVGFGLTAYVIGVEEGYVTKDQAQERTLKTLQTIKALQEKDDGRVSWNGFLAHFIDSSTGNNQDNCEISSIDTAIMLCGVITAGEYFGGEVKTLADQVYSNVNWNSFVMTIPGRTTPYIAMSHKPGSNGVEGPWDWYAEQLMIYVLGAGSPVEANRLDDKTYYGFTRKEGNYNGHKFYYSWFGSIFTYQFSHAWIDFSGIVDKNGTNWYDNSVEASISAYEYCKDNAKKNETFAAGGWGLTACDVPGGYSGLLGCPPRGWNAKEDPDYSRIEGTIAPCGAIGSVVFTPKESLEALKYYQSIRFINGKYGLTDSYNLQRDFFENDYIGIDKGISILMLSNFKDKTVWNYFMQNSNIKNGLDVLGFTAVN